MTYLYGDASESPLDRNYIEFLRALLEFGSSMLQSYATIARHLHLLQEREATAVSTLEQLRGVGERLTTMLSQPPDGPRAVATTRCIEAIRGAGMGEVHRAEAAVQATLTGEVKDIKRAIEQERAQNLSRFQKLLLRHDLPQSSQRVSLRLEASGRYAASLIGRAAVDIGWVIDLDIPGDHLLNEPLRIDRLAPQLTVQFPAESGWVRKSVKLRSYKLGSKYLTRIAFTKDSAAVALRDSLQGGDGFDIIREGKAGSFFLRRVAKGTESEPYEAQMEDVRSLLPVWDTLLSATAKLQVYRRSLREAEYDGAPVQELTNTPVLIKRLVAQAAPIVNAIAKHSLSPSELVLKRVLADNRREEIFVSKADLLQIIAPLPQKLRKLFDPLGLHEGAKLQPLPRVKEDEVATEVQPPAKVAVPLATPLPKPSAPPPPKRRGRRKVGGQGQASPGQPAGDGQDKSDSVEVPIDDFDDT